MVVARHVGHDLALVRLVGIQNICKPIMNHEGRKGHSENTKRAILCSRIQSLSTLLTLSVQHLGDIQVLLSDVERQVQVLDRVIL